MSPRLRYIIQIKNEFTKKVNIYEMDGPIKNVVKAINEHYGCLFISTAGINNIISRPNIIANRFKGISITRYQKPTKKYENGVGSRHKPINLREIEPTESTESTQPTELKSVLV